MRLFKIIIPIVLCFLIIYAALTTSTINKHKEEINRLRKRVHNLELIVNEELIKPSSSRRMAFEYAERKMLPEKRKAEPSMDPAFFY
jgi:hypothetical protein